MNEPMRMPEEYRADTASAKKNINTFLVLEIAVVVLLIVSIAYVYMYMYGNTPEVVQDTVMQEPSKEEAVLTSEEKHAILDALRDELRPEMEEEQKMEVLTALKDSEQSESTPMSEEEKMKVLQGLRN